MIYHILWRSNEVSLIIITFLFHTSRCQQRCQLVPCRTWGMTRPGVLSFVAMVLTVVKMTWVSCWHFCLVVHVGANMPHLLVNWFPNCVYWVNPLARHYLWQELTSQLAEHTYTQNIVCHPFPLPFRHFHPFSIPENWDAFMHFHHFHLQK